jgi:Tol biopolymer transport system component
MGARLSLVALIALVLAASADPAHAQYFGRNKVRYDDTGFQTLQTKHFDIYFRRDSAAAAEMASELAERWYVRLSAVFSHQLSSRQPLILYASHAAFEQTNVVSGFLGEGVGGVTESQQRRIILPFDAGLSETNHVIGHEIVHAFQYDIAARQGRSVGGLPLWFIEGMAEYLSVGPNDPFSMLLLRDAAQHKHLPTLKDLGASPISPYRAGQALFAFLGAEYGEAVVARVLSARSRDAVRRIEMATGATAADLTTRWHASINRAVLTSDLSTDPGRAVIDRKNGGRMNIAPSLSPDGRHLAFLSERDQLSIDVFVADAKTGSIEKKLLTSAADPHIESLGFLRSSGAWSPDGTRLLMSLVKQGRPVFAIYNVEDGSLDRDLIVDGVDQVFQPSWSPDGRLIAFAGLSRGVTDLFLFDLETGEAHRLTEDAYSDLQPVWSPDGRRLAFISDRSASDVSALTFGKYQLALMELSTGSVTPLPGFEGGAADPQWTIDGSALFFRAALNNVPDVFRINIDGSGMTRLTRTNAAVTGLTAYSPALSAALREDTLAFSVLRDGRFEIRMLDGASVKTEGAGEALPARLVDQSAVRVSAMLGQPVSGAPPVTAQPQPYVSKLALTGIGLPAFSMGTGGGGTGSFVRGGTSLLFSDVLGDRRFGMAIQGGLRLEDLGFHALYLNRSTRWTWGAGLEVAPYVDGSRQRVIDAGNETRVLIDNLERERQMHSIASGLLMYPFHRSLRLEFRGGYHVAQYHRITRSRTFSLPDGKLIREDLDRDAPSHQPLSLVEAGVALVRDTAAFGAVSPIMGNRVRLELTSAHGDTSFLQVLSDYRRYWLLPARPYALAVRVMHIGRYGSGADDTRLVPLSLRRQGLVRGVEGSMLQSCAPSGNMGCVSNADTLAGNRLIAAQVELRFPLLGMFSRRLSWGSIPLEGFAFADAGAVWGRQDLPSWLDSQTAARSVGTGARVNAGGFVVEFAAARRLGSDAPGWKFVFNARPPF